MPMSYHRQLRNHFKVNQILVDQKLLLVVTRDGVNAVNMPNESEEKSFSRRFYASDKF